jgi:hypothetical protein
MSSNIVLLMEAITYVFFRRVNSRISCTLMLENPVLYTREVLSQLIFMLLLCLTLGLCLMV